VTATCWRNLAPKAVENVLFAFGQLEVTDQESFITK
jgi:hypothetical protein